MRLRGATLSFSLASVLLLSACGGDDDAAPVAADLDAPVADLVGETSSEKPKHRNRLADEKSPYLLQHANNPVDWYPWGEEAFKKARDEDKPIFLSVGYSTCHWCHVMERESFENEGVAAILNEHFVSIKVDREERPDLDRVYMSFVQATTGRGGWPMSVWLTADRTPFYGGTYYPRESVGGRPGFIELLQRIDQMWDTNRAALLDPAAKVVDELRNRAKLAGRFDEAETPLNEALLDSTYAVQVGRFDAENGGFGRAPKFPRPVELLFLHRIYLRTGDAKALDMSKASLLAMANGGIFDHLGGGFHRYATDALWRLPHFEKMLYDQAQLVWAYLEAYQLTGEPRLAEVARGVLDYVKRDLTGSHGGFLSAEDADSALDPAQPDEKLEGAYYVWKHAELDSILDDDELAFVMQHYGVTEAGNISSRELRGYNVLYIDDSLAQSATALKLTEEETLELLPKVHEKLLLARSNRLRPHLDDKVVTAWNGLMISAYARAAQVLDSREDLKTATLAADFILETLWDEKRQQLLRRYRDGEAGIPAFNNDYSYFVQALLDLYEASFDIRWFDWARRITDRQIELFGDPEVGGFFEVTDEDPTVLIRTKEDYDGAQPTSNSVTALNLLRLAEMTDSARYRAQARQTLDLYAPTLKRYGAALPAMLTALDFFLSAPRQIIIAGQADAVDTHELLRKVHERFLPHKVLLLADGGAAQQQLAASLPFLQTLGMDDDRATAYVCQNYACQLPVTDPTALAAQLDARTP